jgi:cob(I)alamin adenosyltransferase
MPKVTRIYTRTGDDGMTGLVGGGRIKKSAARIASYGTLDELSSEIGVARAALRSLLETERRAARLDAWLAWTQDALFDLGSELATLPDDRVAGQVSAGDKDVAALEGAIDAAQRDLPALAEFIHPGGSLPGAHLHVARTVCRRAERLVVALADDDEAAARAVRFLNRLSDALFVWARWINHALGVPEHVWNKSRTPPD